MNEIIVYEPAVPALSDLAGQINEEIHQAEASARGTTQHALKAGELLIRAKAVVEHGQWEGWLIQHCVVAPRTAQAYMRLVNTLPKLSHAEAQRVADLPLRQAIKAIATDPVTPPRQSTYKAKDISEAMKVEKTVASGASTLRSIAKDVGRMRTLSAKRVATLREKLLSVISLLDQVGGVQ